MPARKDIDDRHGGGDTQEAPWAARMAGWLRGGRGGLFVLAVLVGVGSGLGAVAFRYLISSSRGWPPGTTSSGSRAMWERAPALARAGFLRGDPGARRPVYGPLVYRFAREARGHGVPEVMFAVADNGGRIRPQVTVVKALASALCIGGGGSVGREGPIVQIGSALASSLGQRVRMPETRLRVLVACGAAGGSPRRSTPRSPGCSSRWS